MAIQIGRKKQVPIYNETTTTVQDLSTSTIENYFTVTQGSSYGWSITGDSGLSLKPSNIGVNSSTATITLEAVRDLSGLIIVGCYYTEQNYDKITLTVAGETILNAASGVEGSSNPTTGSTTLTRFVDNKELKQGDTIVFQYVKDSSQSHTYESYTNFKFYNTLNYTTTTTEITGYEEKIFPQNISNLYLSPTKKVIGGWIKTSSTAKLFYGGLVLDYTGDYTVSTVTIDDTDYDLYTLTSSGTLTLYKEAQVWACGGGAGGSNIYNSGSYYYFGGGGGGGYVLQTTSLQKNIYNVEIGAGGTSGSSGSATKIGDYIAEGGICNTGSNSRYGGNGGSGGGSGFTKQGDGVTVSTIPGKGAGISTYPFGIENLKAHSAGGGGGGRFGAKGRDGGTNGSDGSTTDSSNSTGMTYAGGKGGTYGGGDGGGVEYDGNTGTSGYSATFYGGGGGAACGTGGQNTAPNLNYKGGSGYQGVVYIAIPK